LKTIDDELPIISGFSFIADFGYPSRICSSIFISGCNMRCPYCINRDLVNGYCDTIIDPHDLIRRLQARQEKMVVLSGGEALAHPNIFNLIKLLYDAGFEVGICTNGSFPEKVLKALKSGMVEHIIMDIKAALNKDAYSKVSGRFIHDIWFDRIIETMNILKGRAMSIPSAEFRTTVCSKFVDKEAVISIAEEVGDKSLYFLQPFSIHQTLDPEVADEKYKIPFEELVGWADEIRPLVYATGVREV
jgi:pyruvate formate lyase activating enzyme